MTAQEKLEWVVSEFKKNYVDKWAEIGCGAESLVQHHEFNQHLTHCRSTMYTLCKVLKPNNVLEIGSWKYYCANIMGLALEENKSDGYVYSFDIMRGGYDGGSHAPLHQKVKAMFWLPHHTPYDEWKYSAPIVHPEFAHMNNVTIFNTNLKKLNSIKPSNGFELILIDGDHSYEGAKFDYMYSKAIKSEQAIICIDDLYDDRHIKVRKFFNDIDAPKYDFYDWNKQHPDKFTSMGIVCL